MSMTTTLTINKNGKTATMSFVTQQYEVGLYVAIYTTGRQIPEQTGSNMTEYEYHRSLRDSAKKEKNITFVKDQSDPLNRKEVMAELLKLAEDYAVSHGWKFTKDERGIGLNTAQINTIRGLPEHKAIEAKLEW